MPKSDIECPSPTNAPADVYRCRGICGDIDMEGKVYSAEDLHWSGFMDEGLDHWWNWRCLGCIDEQKMANSGISLADKFAQCGVMGCDIPHLPESSRCELHATRRWTISVGDSDEPGNPYNEDNPKPFFIGQILKNYDSQWYHAHCVDPSYKKSFMYDLGKFGSYREAAIALMADFARRAKGDGDGSQN